MTVMAEAGAFRVVAIIAAYNEGDVIHHVVGDLVANGVQVYLIDNCSSDDTVAQAAPWLGRGLLHIERFPDDAGYSARSQQEYVWRDLLRRKQELAATLGADWYIHADADEFREPIWPHTTLADGLRRVDDLGYNAVTFDVFNFRPVEDTFAVGADVRRCLEFFEPCEQFDALQIKAWKHPGLPVDLVGTGGHEAQFPGRRVFPFPFLLRHYPIRGATQGRKKIFEDRLPRFAAEERAGGWHVQYDALASSEHALLWDPDALVRFDGRSARSAIVERVHESQARFGADRVQSLAAEELSPAQATKLYNSASALYADGHRERARALFEVLLEMIPCQLDLVAKIHYKLALLETTQCRQVDHLRICLTLLPDHRAARARLDAFADACPALV
jgi:hypothetical protein